MSKEFKVIKTDIFDLQKPVDLIIYIDKNALDLVLKCSSFNGSKYSILLPQCELNEDNVLSYMEEYYKKAFDKAKELDFRTIAIQAIDLFDEELNYAFAKEFNEFLLKNLSRTKIDVVIVCDDKALKDVYDYAFFGVIKVPQVEIIDNLQFNDFVLIPTTKKIFKMDKKYKHLKKTEPKKLFWKCLAYSSLNKGEIAPIPYNDTYYIFMNMLKAEKKRDEVFTSSFVNGLENVFDIMSTMCYKDVTLPIVHFSPNKKENINLVKLVINMAYEKASEKEFNIKLYCPYNDLRQVAEEYLIELMGDVEDE